MNYQDETVQGRVLIVDDEEGMRNYLSVVLSRDGHRTEVAADGLSALEMCRQNEYDVVLLDLKMPEMDGFEVMPMSEAFQDLCSSDSACVENAGPSIQT